MNARQIADDLGRDGVELWLDAGRLRYRAPRGVVTPERLELLRRHRDELIVLLDSGALRAPAAARGGAPADQSAPFPVTDVQGAYLVGRRSAFPFGGVGCHGYAEIPVQALDDAALERGWRALIERHGMLRAVFGADGTQRVLERTPPFAVEVADARAAGCEGAARVIEATRAAMSGRVYDPSVWPLFDLRVTHAPDRSVLHVSFDLLAADFASVALLLDELKQLHDDCSLELPPVGLTFRDYVIAQRDRRAGARHERDREWWADRARDLPPGPELPVDPRLRSDAPTFGRLAGRLSPAAWTGLCARARSRDLTPNVAVLAAYADVIARWSASPSFTLSLTLMDRSMLHPDVERLVGDFTSVNLLGVEHRDEQPFEQRAAGIQQRLWEDLDHRTFSGVEVAREVARATGSARRALFPVVFTSTIGVRRPGAGAWDVTAAEYAITQTPQVWIDCQVTDVGGGLAFNWDLRDGVLRPGVAEDMFAAFAARLERLADEDFWRSTEPVPVPRDQSVRRVRCNDTGAPISDALLHDALVRCARRAPARPAVVCGTGVTSYGELLGAATRIAGNLVASGTHPGDVVAVACEKGVEQIAAVVGVLLAGAAYLPIDPAEPAARRAAIVTNAKARAVLTTASAVHDGWPASAEVIIVGMDRDASTALPSGAAYLSDVAAHADDLAYVIYTSGSTGTPKGVMIRHRSAVNTIADINRRFAVTGQDRVLGLAGLGFDLSVYDIFGVLGAGGCLVLPDAGRLANPAHWTQLLAHHGVTIWNSVPAQAQMLADYLRTDEGSRWRDGLALRLVMMSGDWIPVRLPGILQQLLPRATAVSLGGATEASIWSVHHVIEDLDPSAASVPYGTPLANQTVHVLDASLAPVPDWTPGELYIGGVGVALGYLDDDVRTAERFIVHPQIGERLYKTGDVARWRDDGSIELLGRKDLQVKIRGHRIELAEVEAALADCPGVLRAIALVSDDDPDRRQLAAAVVVDDAAGGPDVLASIVASVRSRLPEHMVPRRIAVVGELPLTANGKVDRHAALELVAACASETGMVGPSEAPVGDLEEDVAAVWRSVLGVDAVGRHDDFVGLGGNSLLASNLVVETMRSIPATNALGFDHLLVSLLNAPTVAGFARAITSNDPGPAHAPRGNASFAIPLSSLSCQAGEATTVVVHDEDGTLDGIWPVVSALMERGPTVGLRVEDIERVLAFDPGSLVERLADEHAQELTHRFGHGRYRVVGVATACVVAIELARRLRETGNEVDELVVVGDRLPVTATGEPKGPAGDRREELRQHFLRGASRYVPFPFVGDVTIIEPAEPTAPDRLAWEDLCLGAVHVIRATDELVRHDLLGATDALHRVS